MDEPLRRDCDAGSQATRPSRPRIWAHFVLLVCWIPFLGCNLVETDSQASQPLSSETRPTATPENAPFVWPEDPSHPILEVAVESEGIAGTILIELLPDLSPVTVAHVMDLARDGYYDGTTFHRVIPGFMIQGGDPNSRDRDPRNDGLGAPDDQFADEFGAAPFARGVVGMGNKGRADSNTPQFFIMHADNPNLTGRYTVIGRVARGMSLVDQIAGRETDKVGRWGPKDRPIENVVMKRVQVTGPLSAIMLEETPSEHAPAALK